MRSYNRKLGNGAAIALLGACLCILAGAGAADEPPSFDLTIRDHRFEPDTLKVPAGKKFRLVVHNADPVPEEFESYELNREKIVPGHGERTLYIGPLKPGVYPFIGEFHADTAKGQIIAE